MFNEVVLHRPCTTYLNGVYRIYSTVDFLDYLDRHLPDMCIFHVMP